jgi:cysteine desulfurase
MADIGKICQEHGIPLVSDATQAFGKIPVNPVESGVDSLTISSHKIYGPKGVGALYINKNLKSKPLPLIHGGGHEGGYRSGTLNVPGIVGLGSAASLAGRDITNTIQGPGRLRDQLENIILNGLEAVSVNGDHASRLPTVTNLAVSGVESQAVMSRFRSKLAISSGSACSSANPAPSHVLLAMGLTPSEAKSSFRFSLGRPTTADEIIQAAQIFIDAVNEERAISPLWQMMKSGIDLS